MAVLRWEGVFFCNKKNPFPELDSGAVEVVAECFTDPESRCHDMNVWKNVVLWFDGIRESAEGSPEQ